MWLRIIRTTEITKATADPEISKIAFRRLLVLLWALMHDDGIINVPSNEVEALGAFCELLIFSAGAVVFCGLGIEVVVALQHPVFESWLGRWGPVVSASLVALGVGAEVMGASWSGDCQSELTRRSNERVGELEKEAAEARERTAEIERLTMYRRISLEQRGMIAERIKPVPSAFLDVLVEYERGDTEAYTCATDMLYAFRAGGVKLIRLGPNSMLDTTFGIFMTGGAIAETGEDVDVRLIAQAFHEGGLSVGISEWDISSRPTRNGVPPNLYVFVGPKPPPPLHAVADETTEMLIAAARNT
jgi:hypothetical protein